jgi:hypothetical protein
MKSTAFLINASRGQIVDQDALVEALRNNAIAGAGTLKIPLMNLFKFHHIIIIISVCVSL